jgi:16S rRNA (cytosine1402-N4)-methyltransferase
MTASALPAAVPHIPVLIGPLVRAVAPVRGTWLDGTFGAGGYARELLAAGADRVIGVDRDPLAFQLAADWAADYGPRLILREGRFSDLDRLAGEPLDGVVLDLGVSSMQLDRAERGFSFQKDGPLDMRMGQAGPTAADLVNTASEGHLADILFHFGEEHAARRIARAIVAARPVSGTLDLAQIIARCLPRPKPGQSHPATRSFQAIRIAVNEEYRELADGLAAAERALRPGGWLAVVTFHSVEDRMVKRFMALRGGKGGTGSRYAPEASGPPPGFEIVTRKPVEPDAVELAANPRARSARLRIARRLASAPFALDPQDLAMPALPDRRTR